MREAMRKAQRNTLHRRPWRYQLGTFALVLGLVALLLPSPYVIESPGPTQDVLGKSGGSSVIDVKGQAEHADSGRLLMVTVSAAGVPGYPVITAQTLWAWADPHLEVTPSEAVFPVGQSAEDYQKLSDDQMSQSEKAAQQAGLHYAAKLGVDVDAVTATMHIDDIGGPSAGMMYTLGIIDKLTASRETGGQVIAGTGTMNASGHVGSIGGIRLKMLGARRDGATWFLAPKSNCNEVVGHVPAGLRDVQVSTIDDAYKALVDIGQGKADALPHCSA